MSPITSNLSMINSTEMASEIPSSIPIADKVKELFAEYSASTNQERTALMNSVNTIDPSNPVQLLQFQNRVGKYSLAMNMISTLTHKSVSAIDTVLKAQ
ncbi:MULTISPECIES: type III secretion system inner rod subunit SctI [Providencia]|uniref:Type III secretion system needle complex protein PrgJ n=1 Tax=Providencia rettgeri TaxID=587 RepID=A0A379FKR6_PRORE|nr:MULTISPECIES: type III secretion system inner rod subunit SctI [Providencia]MBI6203401.1 type III secretion system inner rod subunit SctI [Providencia rettgeri]QXB06238.1 type III secretion system inner rod subunit SctI [Providencia rettgeri]SUC29248.1 type III secretion system needle complex protein PrgJ [Providencia rettgeri]HEM7130767.1 type III secretion system inner rod subunit SctI [Providencia rettgeri]